LEKNGKGIKYWKRTEKNGTEKNGMEKNGKE
jgi:hypothetical protein